MQQDFDVGSIVNQAVDAVSTWGLRVIGAIAVLIIGRLVAGWGRRVTARSLARAEVDEKLVPFIRRLFDATWNVPWVFSAVR